MPQIDNFKEIASEVVSIEQQAIADLQQYIDDNFEQACKRIYHCHGRVIVIGMGKSGHIAGKIAATLASTGTPAFFVHPGEASHGDLGMITKDDIVLTISNSGETAEVVAITPLIKRLGCQLIAMTGNSQSTLARLADVHLCIAVKKEACPLGLAPTSSTTATLVMGDALAVALLKAKSFTADDFALSHPGGSLGKRLLLRLQDIMHQGDAIPKVPTSATIKEALLEMSSKGLGMTVIVDDNNTIAGLFTDGDLRRLLEAKVDIHLEKISAVMTTKPTVASADTLAAEALKIMEDKKINGLIVANAQQQAVGALNMHDLLRSGII